MGDFIFFAGQADVVPGTREFAGPDIKAQTRQTLQNIKAILEAGGPCLEQVVKTENYLHSIQQT